MHNYRNKPNEKNYPLNIGALVVFTNRTIEWYLNHTDIYECRGKIKKKDEKEIQLFMYAAMFKVPIYGVITGFGAEPNCYRVNFTVEGMGTFTHYFNYKRDFTLNKLYKAINE